MQTRPEMPFHLSLELTKISMILLIYSPFAFAVRPLSDGRSAVTVAGLGLLLVVSLTLRSFVFRQRTSAWAKVAWSVGDLVVWGLSARYANWDMPISLAGFMCTADVTMLGWRYRRGLWFWLASACFVSLGPVLLGEPLDLRLITGYVLPIVPGCVFVYLFLRIIGSMFEARAVAEHARKEAELANVQLREYAEQVEQAAMLRERNRLARDVHDTIAHGFTSMHMQLEVLELLMREEPDEAVMVIAQMKEQVRISLGEVRRSVHALRPLQMEERRGIEGIRKLVSDFVAATGVVADVVVEGNAVELPVAQELCIYRAVQEGLTNAFRHGQAGRARVRLLFATDAITVVIEDDGVGAKGAVTGGLGIVGIRERSAVLGGAVTAGTARTGGFVLSVKLPLTSAQSPAALEVAQ